MTSCTKLKISIKNFMTLEVPSTLLTIIKSVSNPIPLTAGSARAWCRAWRRVAGAGRGSCGWRGRAAAAASTTPRPASSAPPPQPPPRCCPASCSSAGWQYYLSWLLYAVDTELDQLTINGPRST